MAQQRLPGDPDRRPGHVHHAVVLLADLQAQDLHAALRVSRVARAGQAALPRLPPLRPDHLHRLRQVRPRLPGGLHLHRQDQEPGRQGLPGQRLQDRLHQVHVLRPVRRSVPGGLHLHGLDLRPELLQPGRLHRRFRQAAGGGRLGPGDPEPDGGGRVEAAGRAGLDKKPPDPAADKPAAAKKE